MLMVVDVVVGVLLIAGYWFVACLFGLVLRFGGCDLIVSVFDALKR